MQNGKIKNNRARFANEQRRLKLFAKLLGVFMETFYSLLISLLDKINYTIEWFPASPTINKSTEMTT